MNNSSGSMMDSVKSMVGGDIKIVVAVVVIVIILLIIFFIWRRWSGSSKNRGHRNKDGSPKESSSSSNDKGTIDSVKKDDHHKREEHTKEEHKRHETRAESKPSQALQTPQGNIEVLTGSHGIAPPCNGNCGGQQVNASNQRPSNPAHLRERERQEAHSLRNYQHHEGTSRNMRHQARVDQADQHDDEERQQEEDQGDEDQTPPVQKSKSVRFATKNDD
jgi:FtsZ-interacting cell division protein ZipA